MLRTVAVAIAALVALSLPVTASAADSYKGKTKQNRPLKFKVSGGKVRGFEAGVNMFCTQSGFQFNAVIPPRPMRIRGGRFSYKGEDRSGSTRIVIKGRISGGRATGSVQQSDSTYYASTGTFDTCSGKSGWTARRR